MTHSGGVAAAAPQSRNYVLGLLFLLNILLVLDKIVFVILLEPIKKEFQLTDIQLGVLTGLVYALLMGAAAVPFGIAADRGNRRNLAALCLGAWSGLTAACGMAQNFWQLLLARMGVGIGEAGGGPAALSIIADLFEHRKRATAMAVFSLATPMAALLNLMVGTQISHAYGWRATLLAASVPGIVVALLMFLTMKEPRRGSADGVRGATKAPPLLETLRFIASQRALVHLLMGALLSYVTLAGISSWHFSFFVRSFHVKLNEVGPQLGLAFCLFGLTSNFLSGLIADRLAKRDERWRAWIMALGALASVPLCLGFVWAQDWATTMYLSAAFAGICMFWLSPAYALTQSLVAVRMRSTIAGILFLVANMIGYGIGPPLVGALSDLFAVGSGSDSLRMAFVCTVMLNLWAGLHFFLASRALRKDLAAAQAMDAGTAG